MYITGGTGVTLAEAINSWQIRPIEYGTSDCCAFVDHVVYKMTGKSYLPEYDEEYAKGMSVSEAVSKVLGEPTDAVRPGDPVLIRFDGVEALGILFDGKYAVALTEHGMPRGFPRKYVIHGWDSCRV
jgi:hypothetical protein